MLDQVVVYKEDEKMVSDVKAGSSKRREYHTSRQY